MELPLNTLPLPSLKLQPGSLVLRNSWSRVHFVALCRLLYREFVEVTLNAFVRYFDILGRR